MPVNVKRTRQILVASHGCWIYRFIFLSSKLVLNCKIYWLFCKYVWSLLYFYRIIQEKQIFLKKNLQCVFAWNVTLLDTKHPISLTLGGLKKQKNGSASYYIFISKICKDNEVALGNLVSIINMNNESFFFISSFCSLHLLVIII